MAAISPGRLHERYDAWLNGQSVQHDSDRLPDPVPCELGCGTPVWVGSITCLVDGHPDEGAPWSGVWELHPTGQALRIHRCPALRRLPHPTTDPTTDPTADPV